MAIPEKDNVAGKIHVGPSDALIVVDVQRDFCPGGSLGVPDGDEIIPVINKLSPMFGRWIFTRDWHPANHISFSATPEYRDGSWPPHAVQGTRGAEWCEGLELPPNAILVSKGDHPAREAYSGFQVEGFDLAAFLRHRGIDRLFITGLTTDYCVRQTALDGRRAGFEVYLVEDGVKGVSEETTRKALADLGQAGVRFAASDRLEDSGKRPPADYDDEGNSVSRRHE